MIVVDNGSHTPMPVTEPFDHRTVLVARLEENRGFTGGNNAGIQLALNAGCEIVGILNNDTVVDRSFLGPIVGALEDARDVAVCPTISYLDGEAGVWFAGSVFDRRLGLAVHTNSLTEEPYYLTGCALFTTARVWQRVGLLDERFFLDFEDVDWSRRALRAGVALRVVRDSSISHGVSQSIRTIGGLSSYLYARNGAYLSRRPYLSCGRLCRFAFIWRTLLRPHLRGVGHRDRGALRSLCLMLVGMTHGLLGVCMGPPRPWVQRCAGIDLRTGSYRGKGAEIDASYSVKLRPVGSRSVRRGDAVCGGSCARPGQADEIAR